MSDRPVQKGCGKKKRKKGMLKGITFDEVSHVGAGANQGAHVVLFKSAGVESIFKRDFNAVLEEILLSERAHEFAEELSDVVYALNSANWSVLYNPEEYPNMKAVIRENLGQFMDYVSTLIYDTDLIKCCKEVAIKCLPGDYQADGRFNKSQLPMEDILKVWQNIKPANAGNTADFQEDTEMKKTLNFYKAMAQLTDAEKAHFEKMAPASIDAICTEEAESDSIVKAIRGDLEKINKALENDETFSMNGITVAKSEVGDAMFMILKTQQAQIDKSKRDADEAREKLEKADLEREASEMFPNLPGTVEEKGAILKNIRSMPEAMQAKQIEMLKAGDSAIAKTFTENGHKIVKDGEETAGEQLQKKAEALSAEKGLSLAKAYTAVLETPEGAALYEQSLNEK